MKLRQSNIALFAALTAIVAVLVSSCAPEELVPAKNKVYESISGTALNTNDQLQLNRVASALAKEPNSILIMSDAKVTTLTDSQGDFKAITFQYAVKGKITSMIVPVEEVKNAKGDYANYKVSSESCIMKFSGKQEGYTFEILDRCKSVKMRGQDGSSSISFNDKESYGFDIPLNGGETKISIAR